MRIAYVGGTPENHARWTRVLATTFPEAELVQIDDVDAKDGRYDAAFAYRPSPGALARLEGLRAIFSLGAGVDGLLADPALPDVPIVRMRGPALIEAMVDYVWYATLRYHRGFDARERDQARAHWEWQPAASAKSARRVVVLGLGALGAAVAIGLASQGFSVTGWSRSARDLPGVSCRHGMTDLPAVLPEAQILVNLLPLTPQTRGLFNRDLFAALPAGAAFIHVGRGEQLVGQHLLEALEGHLSGATLDVFAAEPLPPDHPFWRHPLVRVTPHCASYPDPADMAESVAANLRLLQEGRPLLDCINRARGY